MKKIFLALLCAPLLSFGQTSTYFPFPSDSATWSVSYWNFNTVSYVCWNTWHYGITGDTVIGNETYHKVAVNNYFMNVTDTSFNPATASYVAGIREDAAKKVHVIMSADSVEKVLYDFSLNVGDTFYFDYFQQGAGVVTLIDSVLVGSSYRKQWHLADQFSAEHIWIEGTGSLDGILQYQEVSSFSTHLTCHSHHSQMLYTLSGDCHCDNSLRIDEHTQPAFSLYPNPSGDVFMLAGFEGVMNLEILDAAGRVIQSQNVVAGAAVNTSGTAAGVYLVRLTDVKGNRSTTPWIKSSL